MSIVRLLATCLLVVTFVGTAMAGEKLKASPKAKEHFAAGLAHVDDPAGPRYEEAYREFRAAYLETPSYEIAVNVGYCAFFLERDAEALEMYELFLSKADEKDISPKKRAQMERDVQSLRSGLVTIQLTVSPATAVVVDERFPTSGKNIVNRYPIVSGTSRLGIHPGNHRITVTADGYQPQSWEFEAGPGSSHGHEFALVPITNSPDARPDRAESTGPGALPASTSSSPIPQPSRESTSPLVYGGAVATGIFSAGAIGMAIVTSSKKSDFENANDGTQYAKAEGLRSEVKTYALVTDVCLGAAVVSAGITTYLFLTGSKSNGALRNSAWHFAPVFGRSAAGLGLSGTY